MAPSTDIFLKWNGHHNALVPMLYLQLEKRNFVDVTIAAEGKSINAHRLILCAASDYFEELLGQNHELTAVTLQNMKFCDIQSIIEYIYKGEVSLSRNQLGSFLATATFLKVKGLAEEEHIPNQTQEPVVQEEDDPDVVIIDQPPRPPPDIIDLDESMSEDEQIQDDFVTENDQEEKMKSNDEENSIKYISSDSSSSTDEDIPGFESGLSDDEGDPKEGPSAVGLEPNKSSTQLQISYGSKDSPSLREHRLNCDLCGKGFSSKQSLKMHSILDSGTARCR